MKAAFTPVTTPPFRYIAELFLFWFKKKNNHNQVDNRTNNIKYKIIKREIRDTDSLHNSGAACW